MQGVREAKVLQAEAGSGISHMVLLPASSTLLLVHSGRNGFSTLHLDE